MARYLIGTDGVATSETLVDYVRDHFSADDEVYAVNSLRGGDRTSDEAVAEGKAALEVLEESVGAETHQLIRGNSPQEDLLGFAEEHDVDQLVIGIRKRTPTGKILFGSTAHDLLLESDRPVLTVPLLKRN
jgi:nucleotide-binding universal stress UspA family protein